MLQGALRIIRERMSIEVSPFYAPEDARPTHSWLGYIQDESRQRVGSSAFWTVEYYQPYFDVDTTAVRPRPSFDIAATKVLQLIFSDRSSNAAIQLSFPPPQIIYLHT